LKRSLHPTRTSCFLLRFPPPLSTWISN